MKIWGSADPCSPRLSKPAISLYRHHLTSDLESAIRGSNAQYDSPDILRRLDARILEYSHGEIGWDCFALEYKVEAPLNAVLDGKAMVEYERLFHHLWRLKRVEAAITQGWMRVTSGSRSFEKLPSKCIPIVALATWSRSISAWTIAVAC
jgi:gamma-tubulin complex component 3